MAVPQWLNPNQHLPPVLASPLCPPPQAVTSDNMPIPNLTPIWESLPVVQLDFPMGPYTAGTQSLGTPITVAPEAVIPAGTYLVTVGAGPWSPGDVIVSDGVMINPDTTLTLTIAPLSVTGGTGCCNADYSGPLGTGLWPGVSFCPGTGLGGVPPSGGGTSGTLPGFAVLREDRALRRAGERYDESLERQVAQRRHVIEENREIAHAQKERREERAERGERPGRRHRDLD